MRLRIKRIVLVRVVFIFSFSIFCFSYSRAQNIPNSGFEDWVNYPGTLYDIPKNWITNDILYKTFDHAYTGTTVEEYAHSHSGKYALLMKVIINHNDTVNGGIYSTGNIDSLIMVLYKTHAAGFKCSTRYKTFTGYYIFNSKEGDTAVFGVDFTAWNKGKGRRDTLVNATLKVGQKAPDYLPFVVPLKYRIENEIPDTAFIAIGIQGANSKSAHVGTSLVVDDLMFSDSGEGKK